MLEYAAFDADNHYYEAPDAYTRHIEKSMAKRTVQWAEINGRKRLLVAGAIHRFIPNPLFDPVAKPGCLYNFFRGENPSDQDIVAAFGDLEPINPGYRDPAARIPIMDEQHLEAAWMYPTLGVGVEETLRHDPPALVAALRAFNRWLHDDWSFNYHDRLFAVPAVTLADLDAALTELDWLLERDARIIYIRQAPVPTPFGNRSPADAMFDPYWARVEEAGLTVSVHAGDDGYTMFADHWEPTEPGMEAFRMRPFQTMVARNRPVFDFFASIACNGLFDRFPRLRFASIENGASWVPGFLKSLKKARAQNPGYWQRDPVAQFIDQVSVAPFWEDSAEELLEVFPAERILFGSDWPHAEGLQAPLDYLAEIKGLDDAAIKAIMRDNTAALTVRAA